MAKTGRSTASLMNEQAVYWMADSLLQIADPDEALKKAGKTRKDLRPIEYDDEVGGALETRLSALLAVPWRLEGDEAAVKFIEEQFNDRAEDWLTIAWNSGLYGYSVGEAVWIRDGGRLAIDYISEKPFEWFKPIPRGGLQYFGWNGGSGLIGQKVDTACKFFLTTNRATYRNPFGESWLSRLFWPWYFRSAGWRFWARYLERHGSPLMVGKTAGSTSAMVTMLEDAVNSAVAAIGMEDEITPVGAAGSGESFQSFEDAVNRRIQRYLLGQTLTSDTGRTGGGSLALGRVHNEVRRDRTKSDVRRVVPTLQRIVNALCSLNDLTPPRFIMEIGEGLATERADRDVKLAGAGIVKFTENYVQERYGLEPEDFTIPTEASASESALSGPVVRMATSAGRLERNQDELDEVAADAIALAGDPIDADRLKEIVANARSPEELVARLAEVFDDEPESRQFVELMEKALFAWDLLGFQHAGRE